MNPRVLTPQLVSETMVVVVVSSSLARIWDTVPPVIPCLRFFFFFLGGG